MFTRNLRRVLLCVAPHGTKNISTTTPNAYKVVVIGASGGVGQPLSLMLKRHPLISHLCLYDVAPVTPGVAVDLSHMNTPTRVTGYQGIEQLLVALQGAKIVMIPAGVPVKPGMTRDDVFGINASIVSEIMKAVAKACPMSFIGIITNPVNSIVPVAAEVLKKAGAYNRRRLFGITTLDVIRANTFVAELICCDPRDISIPVVGGHSEGTMVPLLSQCNREIKDLGPAKIEAVTQKIRNAGLDVVKLKGGQGSATLATAFAAVRFISSLLKALQGARDVVECAYVESSITEAKYFTTPLLLGVNGIENNLGLGSISEYEKQLLECAIPEIKCNIHKGEEFVAQCECSS